MIIKKTFNYQASPRLDMIIKIYLRKTLNYQASMRLHDNQTLFRKTF